MSFQFSPETFIIEIDFQIEQIQSDIDNLSTSLNNKLDVGLPERVAARFEAPAFARFGVPSIPAILNLREFNASKSARAVFNSIINDLTKQISTLETKINDLLTQRRTFQTEIDVRAQVPTLATPSPLVVLTQEQPQIIIQKEQLPLKELALIGGAVLLLS